MKPIRALSALLGLALAWPSVAQDSPSPTKLSTAERQAFELKGRGQTAAARDAFLELARSASGDSVRDGAMAEYYADMAGMLTLRTGAVRQFPDASTACSQPFPFFVFEKAKLGTGLRRKG